MSVQISIGLIDKRINSTKALADASFAIKDLAVLLKEPCSMTGPVFQISRSNFPTAGFYNYAKWGTWYYWIDDIIYLSDGIVEVHTHLDVLATFKTDIGNAYGLVAYGDSSHWNTYADDTRFHPEKLNTKANGDPSTQVVTANMFGMNPSKEGCIVMTFTQTASVDWMQSGTMISGCGVHTALMTTSQFQYCIGDLINFDLWTGWSGDGALEIVQSFQRLVQSTGGGSLLDNIQRVVWIPFAISDILAKLTEGTTHHYTQRQGMMIGGVLSANTVWYETTSYFVINHNVSFGIGIDDLVNGRHFLKNDRWISLQICTPGGYANVATDKYKWSNTLYIRSSFCINDGSWSTKVCKNSDHSDTLASFSGCLGVNMKGAIYAGQTPSSLVADAGAAFVTSALAMGIGNIASGVLEGQQMRTLGGYTKAGLKQYATTLNREEIPSGITGLLPHTNTNIRAQSGTFGGSVTSMFLTDTPGLITIYAEVWAPADIANYTSYCDRYGYPCNKYLQLSTISGFLQCAGASVSASGASDSMLSTINSYVNSGIYYE